MIAHKPRQREGERLTGLTAQLKAYSAFYTALKSSNKVVRMFAGIAIISMLVSGSREKSKAKHCTLSSPALVLIQYHLQDTSLEIVDFPRFKNYLW